MANENATASTNKVDKLFTRLGCISESIAHVQAVEVMLCDLDVSHKINDTVSRTDKIGSSAFLAPEVMRWRIADMNSVPDLIVTEAMDVFSFGAILYFCSSCCP